MCWIQFLAHRRGQENLTSLLPPVFRVPRKYFPSGMGPLEEWTSVQNFLLYTKKEPMIKFHSPFIPHLAGSSDSWGDVIFRGL